MFKEKNRKEKHAMQATDDRQLSAVVAVAAAVEDECDKRMTRQRAMTNAIESEWIRKAIILSSFNKFRN